MNPDDANLCECDRPDEADNPHRHTFDPACVYWIAGRPGADARRAAIEGRLPLTKQRPTEHVISDIENCWCGPTVVKVDGA